MEPHLCPVCPPISFGRGCGGCGGLHLGREGGLRVPRGYALWRGFKVWTFPRLPCRVDTEVTQGIRTQSRAPEMMPGGFGRGSGGCRAKCRGRGTRGHFRFRSAATFGCFPSARRLPSPARLSAPLPGAGAAGPSPCGPPCVCACALLLPAARRAPRDTEAERGQGADRHDPREPGVSGPR